MSTHNPDRLSEHHSDVHPGRIIATHNVSTRQWQADTFRELRELLTKDNVLISDVTLETEQSAIPLDEPRI